MITSLVVPTLFDKMCTILTSRQVQVFAAAILTTSETTGIFSATNLFSISSVISSNDNSRSTPEFLFNLFPLNFRSISLIAKSPSFLFLIASFLLSFFASALSSFSFLFLAVLSASSFLTAMALSSIRIFFSSARFSLLFSFSLFLDSNAFRFFSSGSPDHFCHSNPMPSSNAICASSIRILPSPLTLCLYRLRISQIHRPRMLSSLVLTRQCPCFC
mmetsp:Transcript_20005/g.35967  ORF Transcript_20005/g.35967 Transcript_20005/m.35967 type:complete len:217 (-) Transcript_20005:671-1321(-)